MQVRRADGTGELELRGTSAELAGLASGMHAGMVTSVLATTGDPSPYGRLVARMRVTRTSGPVIIKYDVAADLLDVRGGGDQLALLALNIEGVAEEGDPESHLHVDYYPDHDYLAEASDPLVVTLDSPSA